MESIKGEPRIEVPRHQLTPAEQSVRAGRNSASAARTRGVSAHDRVEADDVQDDSAEPALTNASAPLDHGWQRRSVPAIAPSGVATGSCPRRAPGSMTQRRDLDGPRTVGGRARSCRGDSPGAPAVRSSHGMARPDDQRRRRLRPRDRAERSGRRASSKGYAAPARKKFERERPENWPP